LRYAEQSNSVTGLVLVLRHSIKNRSNQCVLLLRLVLFKGWTFCRFLPIYNSFWWLT